MFRKKTSLLEDNLFQTLIAAVTALLARLANLKTAGLYQQAIGEIEKDLEELLGIKTDLARRLSDANILEMLTVNDVLDIGRLFYVAELFREDGEFQKLQGNADEGQASQIRALNLFLEAAFASKQQIPGNQINIQNLFNKWRAHLSEDMLFTLFDYFEQQNSFDLAEQAIDQMLIITHNNPDILFERSEFYRRLTPKTDQELEAGGLSRNRIEQKRSTTNP